MRVVLSSLTVCAALLVLAGACGDEGRVCYPNDLRRCSCADGKSGFERCEPSGDRYAPCDCSGQVPGLGGDGAAGPGYSY